MVMRQSGDVYINIIPIKVGDILCVRNGKSFIARAITYFMKIYKRKRGISKDFPNYHHSAIVIDVWGVMYIAESVSKGFKIHKFDEAYSEKSWKERIDIITPVTPYTEIEAEMLCKIAVTYSFNITRYDFFNFIWQILLILFGRWMGPKGKKAENRLYCSEAVATIINYVRPDTFRNPSATNPIDVATSKSYRFL